MKIYLQGWGLANEPARLLFTGHVGSGKSTPLNTLAEEIKQQYFEALCFSATLLQK